MVYQPIPELLPFWTSWKKAFVLMPSKSITGKWVWGYLNKRQYIIPNGGFRMSWVDKTEYATDREKFISELKDRQDPPSSS